MQLHYCGCVLGIHGKVFSGGFLVDILRKGILDPVVDISMTSMYRILRFIHG